MKTLIVLVAFLVAGCGTLRNTAEEAVALDGATTAVGILSGAAKEGNPVIGSAGVGVASVLARIAAIEWMNRQSEPARSDSLVAMNAVTWGVVANNVLAIIGATHPVSLIAGGIFGLVTWQATERQK